MDWSLLRSFLAIARSGSLAAAARTLEITHPTIRRHLAELEQQLGGSLFTRSPRGLRPTAIAERILPEAARIEAAIGTIDRLAREEPGQMTAMIRLSASEVIGAEVLPPLLADLRDRQPGLSFELILSDDNSDILERDADLAIRMQRPRQDRLVARAAGTIGIGFYAHQRWLDRHPAPTSLEALAASGQMIGQDRRRSLADALGIEPLELRRRLVIASDSDLAQINSIRAGLGVGVMQIPLAARDPALIRVLPAFHYPMAVWLVTHPDLRGWPPIQQAMGALQAGLRRYGRSGEPR